MKRRRQLGISLYASLIIIFCASLFATTGIHPALSQEDSGIKLDARAGFDGYCKQEHWVPVRVRVENSGPDIEARLQVAYQNQFSGQTVSATEISLPTTSRKELSFYVYPQSAIQNLKISLLAGKKTLAQSQLRLTCLSAEKMLWGVLADDAAPYDDLTSMQLLSGNAVVTRLRLMDLPDRLQGWSGLDGLVISGVDTGTLTASQVQSLKLWLAAGGKLLVVGGPKWQSTTAGLKDILPLDIETTTNVAGLPELQTYFNQTTPLEGQVSLATGPVHADAQILVEQDGLPLIVKKTTGFGEIIYLAADPGLQPLSNWDGMKEIYTDLLGKKASRPYWSNGEWNTSNANRALSTLTALKIPPAYSICCWLGLYLIVIGPINFLVVRRYKRREIAWITTPVLVIVFTLIAYFSGIVYRGRQPILNRIAVVQAWDGVDQAQVSGFAGVYSPHRAKYTLTTDDPFQFYPLDSSSANLSTNQDWLTLQQSQNLLLPDVLVEVGGMKTTALDGLTPALDISHNLVIDVSAIQPILTGTVTNNSPYTLKEALIVTPSNWDELGDIAPGESKTIDLSLAQTSNGPVFYNTASYQIIGNGYGYNAQDVDEKTARQRALLDAAKGSTILSYNNDYGNWGFYLMGWLEEPVLPIGIQDKKFKSIDTTLYSVMLQPSFKINQGPLLLPPSLFTWETSSTQASPYRTYQIPPDGYTLHFKPAVPIDLNHAKSIELTFHFTGSGAQSDYASASLWNFEAERWEPIQVNGAEDINIPFPWRYLGPGGEIRLKLQQDQDQYIEIETANFSLKVTP